MANLPSMTPYLIRAFYEWSVDNDFTPQLSVLAEPEDYRVIVPSNYVTNNEIVLNISPTACDSLQLGNDVITFKARFAGKVESSPFLLIELRRSSFARKDTECVLMLNP